MKNTFIIAGLISFAISTLLGPAIIPLLKRIKAGQTDKVFGSSSYDYWTMNDVVLWLKESGAA